MEIEHNAKMKICVITPRFTLSGVPLAQIRFARALQAKGHEVDLIIGYVDPEYDLPANLDVNIIHLNQPKVRGMLFPVRNYLKNMKPDVVFSAEDHLNMVVLLAAISTGSKAKISGSSRVTPFDTYSDTPFTKRWFLKQLVRAVNWRANALTCVSKDMVGQYRLVFKSSPHVDIYNIVDDKASRKKSKEPVDHKWLQQDADPVIIAAGRLARWKGFSDLIRAVSLIPKERNARLIILGDGPQRPELEALVENLGLKDSVDLPGYVNNPLKYFSKSKVFVLSSLVEGLPNVLVEAMMCGCTPVSTDCPTGPREVLNNGKYGYLVPVGNPEELAIGIERALDLPISASLLEEAVQPFEESAVINRHFEVLGLATSFHARGLS